MQTANLFDTSFPHTIKIATAASNRSKNIQIIRSRSKVDGWKSTVRPMQHFSLFLTENVYQPSRCGSVIEELRQCCIRNSSVSLVCEGIDVTKPYEHNTVDISEVQKRR